MKIKYEYVTGETVYVEVDDALGAELEALAHQQENRDRAETRRHDSLEGLLEMAHQFAGVEDVQQEVEQRLVAEAVQTAVGMLTEKQQRVIRQIYGSGLEIVEIARIECVSHALISTRHATALKKLRKILKSMLRIGTSRG